MELQAEYFHHPYSPYDIQLNFMRSLYTCIEEGKVGIFESPTGTGKSLSLICGSLTWLRNYKRKQFLETLESSLGDDEPEWMLEFAKKEKTRELAEKRKNLEARLAKAREEEERIKRDFERPGRPRKKQKLDSSATQADDDGDQFELDDYDSDIEENKKAFGGKSDDALGLSASTLALLERFKGPGLAQDKLGEGDDEDIKIFYCSRTHSQLSQFANELRRVTFPPSLPLEESPIGGSADRTGGSKDLVEAVKHLSLGSRKNLCINPKVSALGNATAINERCLELQQTGVSAEHKCPYLPSKENEALVLEFRDHALATVKDIEDIGKVGKKVGICPYYASRSVIKQSEIVTLPYPLLLQRSARDALGLSVKNHVVIIDEAHNLMDAISEINSASVTLKQLHTALSQLTTYARKYKLRLKGKNRVYITQLIRLIDSIHNQLQSIAKTRQETEGSLLPSDLMAGKGVDQINPHKLSRYLQESKLARKVDGLTEHLQKTETRRSDERAATPVLFHVQSFLLSLMNPSAEGQLFFVKTPDDIQLRYMLLDPTNHFREIVEDARAVILAGGTMSPMTDYADYLFSYVTGERLDTFSYGHVIPADNLAARTLSRGVLGTEFDFTYKARDSDKMINDLGTTIAELCQVIPDGLVAFFPSYDYLNQVVAKWKKTPAGEKGKTVLDLIQGKKPLFYESQDRSNSTEQLLQEYSNAVATGSGALLLSVIGGKLSEGINFSDKLGRGVLVVGLPFPNLHSAVWKAKLGHVEQKVYQHTTGSEENRRAKAKAAGRDFYENACMRAVNQSIGRAIRHRNDYASIIMIDRRYESARIQAKLPAWIKQGLATGDAASSAGRTVQALTEFFRKPRN
ncbi:hypothetical protein DTO166G4_8345 [Paecilomyces variotii]|nr:hypothetical protein DTO166G4_8345 [Paecilomyces variotii]KAJ9243146.1 hypothetical protein DTO166G5_250 [Paecilomyces variotii]KAJ9250431.1 hypothetical protein DTO195F2_8169 [Paecilomyces variotii]KAJ9303786.1 hypothetical protein DTO217A2_6703 [Paecilomyces variotii]KAJ9372528.1 hypothetical protein DTO282E5_2855 [Paecilomyces variotii]